VTPRDRVCPFCGYARDTLLHILTCDGRQGDVERDDEPLYPPSNGTDTSDAAAASVAPDTETIRGQVHDYVRAHGGATCDDVEVSLGLRHQTASARLWELHHKMGLIVDSGQRRRTRSGRAAIVYVVS
jgi:hypothetical protein